MDWGVAKDGSGRGRGRGGWHARVSCRRSRNGRGAGGRPRRHLRAWARCSEHLAGEAAPPSAHGHCRESARPGCQPRAIKTWSRWQPTWRGSATRIPSMRIASRSASGRCGCTADTNCPILLLLAYIVMRFALLVFRGI